MRNLVHKWIKKLDASSTSSTQWGVCFKLLTKILVPNLSFGRCMYVCMYVCIVCSQVVLSKWVLVVMYSHKFKMRFLHMTLHVLGVVCNQVLMSKWVWDVVCNQVLMSKWVWDVVCNQVLMSKRVSGVVCNQVLMSKWVWGVVCNQVLISKMSLGCCMQPSSYVQMSLRCCLPHKLICAREITPSILAPLTLNIYFTFRNVEFLFIWKIFFLKEQHFWWRKLRVFGEFWIIIFDMEFSK
jgi:hypothetical protein